MAHTKSYFRDHYSLLLLSINIFGVILVVLFIILRLVDINTSSYIIQCRNCSDPNALNKYITGGISGFISFILFILIIFIGSFVLSFKTYLVNRDLSITILYFGIFLEVVALIVSNALFILR